MASRPSRGLFGNLVRLPWPAGLAFGLVGFALVHWGLEPWLATLGGAVGHALAKVLASGALTALAWALLLFGVVAAGLSLWRAPAKAKAQHAQEHLASVQALTWAQFEQLVGEAYRRRGYRVEQAGQGDYDGGIDLLLTKDGKRTFVQCKHWRSRHVGVSVVRAMAEQMARQRVDAGKIICTGVFSTDCYRLAVGEPLELVDGEALYKLIAEVRADTMLLPPAPDAPGG